MLQISVVKWKVVRYHSFHKLKKMLTSSINYMVVIQLVKICLKDCGNLMTCLGWQAQLSYWLLIEFHIDCFRHFHMKEKKPQWMDYMYFWEHVQSPLWENKFVCMKVQWHDKILHPCDQYSIPLCLNSFSLFSCASALDLFENILKKDFH